MPAADRTILVVLVLAQRQERVALGGADEAEFGALQRGLVGRQGQQLLQPARLEAEPVVERAAADGQDGEAGDDPDDDDDDQQFKEREPGRAPRAAMTTRNQPSVSQLPMSASVPSPPGLPSAPRL